MRSAVEEVGVAKAARGGGHIRRPVGVLRDERRIVRVVFRAVQNKRVEVVVDAGPQSTENVNVGIRFGRRLQPNEIADIPIGRRTARNARRSAAERRTGRRIDRNPGRRRIQVNGNQVQARIREHQRRRGIQGDAVLLALWVGRRRFERQVDRAVGVVEDVRGLADLALHRFETEPGRVLRLNQRLGLVGDAKTLNDRRKRRVRSRPESAITTRSSISVKADALRRRRGLLATLPVTPRAAIETVDSAVSTRFMGVLYKFCTTSVSLLPPTIPASGTCRGPECASC